MTTPQPTQPLTDREWERLGELVAAGHFDNEYRAVKGLYEAVMRERAEVSRLRAENTAQAAKLAAVEAGLEKARDDNGRTCYETVFWYDGEYEGECELLKYHAGPHFDGTCWWDDDRNEVEAPAAALGLDQDGRGQTNG